MGADKTIGPGNEDFFSNLRNLLDHNVALPSLTNLPARDGTVTTACNSTHAMSNDHYRFVTL